MPFPVAVVEIGFDHGPYTLSPTWTDVTAYVRSMTIDRGRSDDYAGISGSANVVLNNRDRRFDPFNTSGPYYGKLLPRRQIRIRATHGATTYDLFRGFINGFPPTYTDAGKDSTATVDCYDALQLLAGQQLPDDWARPYILSLSPTHYYPLDEAVQQYVTTNTGRDLGSKPFPFRYSTSAYNDSQLAIGLADRSISGDDYAVAIAGVLDVIPSPSLSDFSFSVWTKANGEPFGLSFTGLGGLLGSVSILNYGSSTSVLNVFVTTPLAEYQTQCSLIGNDWSQPFHLAFNWNNTSNVGKIYINGIDRTGSSFSGTGFYFSATWYASLDFGSFQQFATWTRQLTATEIQNIVKFSSASFAETTTARANRIIGQTQFSTSLTSFPVSPAGNCLDISDGAPYVSGELQLIADTEGGPLYVSSAGVLTILQRDSLFNLSRCFVSQATFGTGGELLDPQLSLSFDGDNLRNQVITSMSGGATYTADKTASQTTLGMASMNIHTQSSTYVGAQVIAERVAGLGQEARLSISPFRAVISPSGDWSKVLARELFDRVTVVITPSTGSVITEDVLIRQITHEVTPGQWVTTINGSGRLADYFRADYSFADGPDVVLYS